MVQSLSLYKTLKRILSELNIQVVEHGERLAYLYLKMAEFRKERFDQHIEDTMLVCFSHDIGSYKTEKFANLLDFDAKNTLEHCVYGYLFMKHFSFLQDKAEVFLYHHIPYSQRDKIDSPYIDDGILIHFLDRVDILNITTNSNEKIIEKIIENKGTLFNPKDVDDFIKLQEKEHVLEALREEKYHDDVRAYFDVIDRIRRLIGPVVDMLAFEIDFRSEQTVVHSITTAVIGRCIAEKMNLPKTSIYEIESAGKMHDIGKIRIPSRILEKPGKLTPKEYEVMKKHAEYTEEIISDLFPEKIVKMACRHQERIDGSGYPKGLKGDQLSIPERIVQVADIVSALVYKRSYRDAYDKQIVLSILNEETAAGKFDPSITKIVNDNYDEILNEAAEMSKYAIINYEALQKEYKTLLKKYSGLGNNSIEEYELFTLN